jgi:hypothetical protein
MKVHPNECPFATCAGREINRPLGPFSICNPADGPRSISGNRQHALRQREQFNDRMTCPVFRDLRILHK